MKKSLDAVRSTIVQEIQGILDRKGSKSPRALSDKTSLFNGQAGMDSLDIAELIVRLEELLGADPFKDHTGSTIRTLGDLIAYYSRHAQVRKKK